MFFEASKLAWFVLAPSNALIGLAALGLALAASRFRRFGLRLAAVAVALLAVFGLSPAGHLLMASLEHGQAPWPDDGRVPAGLVVLGGSTDVLTSAYRGQVAVNEAGERLTEAVALARRFPAARIVFTGGDASLGGSGPNEADDARRLFESLGLPPDRVAYERESRTTYENAAFTRRLVEPREGELWLLVTSAYHMPRALAAFRAAGFPVEPYPVDFRTRGLGDWSRFFPTASEGLRRTDAALREYLGLVAYRLTGRAR
jgi:uncharacterized SAM-binding protein YcdF (DUF218 family)